MKKQRTPGVTYRHVNESVRRTGSNSFSHMAPRSPTEKVHKVKDNLGQFGKLSRAQDSHLEDNVRRRAGRFDIVKYFKLK
jgi:hypothetical protein